MQGITEIRSFYREAVDSSRKSSKLWADLSKLEPKEGIHLAYQASARALMANHEWNPLTKLSLLKEAMGLFQKAVDKDPHNIEIRFLRFAIQHHTPDALQLSKHLNEDRDTFVKYAKDYASFDLKGEHMYAFLSFLKKSRRFSKEQINQIESVI
ncbi:MAG: hypothetical protein AAFY71_15940 [Bacteroidota bacterium]